ncbi:aerobic-type carbon monoxide dehydrogenase small subunit (CoxS/CutS family) [Kitasatospora sp. MAA4]|nr:aerobic-type carbon monoxide dehydrogenase small subunit (CoxS/CutS family) [Kitasatospora sp. MAA4]
MTNHPVHPVDERPCASYTLRVNGFERPVTDAWIGESLLYVLRERLGLAGAKNGCEQGECGACSVQVDGQLVAGCLVPAALAADSEISTVEGLSAGGAASDVQQALADSGAVQCGYCTPGMAMAVHDLLQRNHRPSEVEARQALCGNLCRCTGYRSALAAVQTVADARSAALLEAEEAAAEVAASAEPAEPAEPVQVQAESEVPDLPVYQDAWTETAAAGEVPVFGNDDSGWIVAQPFEAPPVYDAPQAYAASQDFEAAQPFEDVPPFEGTPMPGPDQSAGGYQPLPTAAGTGVGVGVVPPQGYPGYDPTAYGPGTVYAAGATYEPTPAHGTSAPGAPFEGTPAHGTPYEPTPAHGTPYGTPAHGTPAQGTGYPGYPDQQYAGAPYEGAGYEGTPYDRTSYDGVGYDGTVYEPAPAAPYDAASAHGLRLPEDDHA